MASMDVPPPTMLLKLAGCCNICDEFAKPDWLVMLLLLSMNVHTPDTSRSAPASLASSLDAATRRLLPEGEFYELFKNVGNNEALENEVMKHAKRESNLLLGELESTHLPLGRGGSILIFSRMLRRSSLWNVWPL